MLQSNCMLRDLHNLYATSICQPKLHSPLAPEIFEVKFACVDCQHPPGRTNPGEGLHKISVKTKRKILWSTPERNITGHSGCITLRLSETLCQEAGRVFPGKTMERVLSIFAGMMAYGRSPIHRIAYIWRRKTPWKYLNGRQKFSCGSSPIAATPALSSRPWISSTINSRSLRNGLPLGRSAMRRTAYNRHGHF
jgi:hypothetical protein